LNFAAKRVNYHVLLSIGKIDEVNCMLYKIGDIVKGKKFGPMDHDFSGEVEKVYENSIMIAIQDYDPSDQSGVNELNGRAIIRKDEAKMLKAVPRTAEDKEAEVEAEKEEAEKEAKKTTGKKATRARRSSKVRIEKPADKN